MFNRLRDWAEGLYRRQKREDDTAGAGEVRSNGY